MSRALVAVVVAAASVTAIAHHHKPKTPTSSATSVAPTGTVLAPVREPVPPRRRAPVRASRRHTRPPLHLVDHRWQAVADCESSGDWHADTGNGYYGGLQFLASTWRSFGGRGRPDKASEAEQIRVAERVLAVQGLRAWPNCGRYL